MILLILTVGAIRNWWDDLYMELWNLHVQEEMKRFDKGPARSAETVQRPAQ